VICFLIDDKERYVFGDEVFYECQKGYKMPGSNNSITCGADGMFENIHISCEHITCNDFPDIPQGNKVVWLDHLVVVKVGFVKLGFESLDESNQSS